MTSDRKHAGFPHGGPNRVTYHLGIVAVLEALAELPEAVADNPVWDFWRAYHQLLAAYDLAGGIKPTIRPNLLEAADELYYWLVYRHEPEPDPFSSINWLEIMTGHPVNDFQPSAVGNTPLDVQILTDAGKMASVLKGAGKAAPPPTSTSETEQPHFGGFVGPQGPILNQAVQFGDNCLLAGPTGTGKTFLTEIVALENEFTLVEIKGMEGMLDLDIIGAILPQEDGSRKWVDGPLVRAMRMAQTDPVILFVDEINRIPREQVNLFIGMMNPKPAELCKLQGIPVSGPGPFYVLEIPMTGEIVWCPTAHLRIVAAGNFGRDYAVYDLDPALRRRFDTVVEFDYPAPDVERKLVRERTGVDAKIAEALVAVAGETRRLYGNGELPGAVDTASLLNWAHKCARAGMNTARALMEQGKLVWADLVVGRDHTGRINQGSFDALVDYLDALALLPKGGK